MDISAKVRESTDLVRMLIQVGFEKGLITLQLDEHLGLLILVNPAVKAELRVQR